MPKMTKRSMSLGKGFDSRYKREDLIAKLGAIEHRTEGCVKKICDNVCRFRQEASDPYEMDDICESCPVNQLMEMIV